MKQLATSILMLGLLVLLHGAIAFFLRIDILTGNRFGPSLTPVYIIFGGILICLVGLTLRTFADGMKK